MPRFDFRVYRDMMLTDRAEPNVMITFSASYKIAAIAKQDFSDLFFHILPLCKYRFMTFCMIIKNYGWRKPVEFKKFRDSKSDSFNQIIK